MKSQELKEKFITYMAFIIFIIIIILTFMITKAMYENKETPKNDENANETIIFLGDSLTHKYKLDEFFEEYPIINSGINGNTTKDIIENLENRVFVYKPTKIILLIGINDMKMKIPKQETIANIKYIAKKIKENDPKIKLYIESIYPIGKEEVLMLGNFKDVKREEIPKYNKEIEEFCNKEKITYINVYNTLLDEKGDLKPIYTKDGIHLTDLGYYKVTKVLEKYINENNN